MDIKEFYQTIGGNYDAAKSRMLSDARIEKYLTKFSSYVDMEKLKNAVETKNYSEVFEITHDMKGMCLNLELTPLARSVSELCEAVRHGEPNVEIASLFDAISSDYEKTITLISELTAM